jgi:hypothetical protein
MGKLVMFDGGKALARKTYDLNDAALENLATVTAWLNVGETDVVHIALAHLAQALKRGFPVYLSDQPEGPQPPTSAPSAASTQPLRVVGKSRSAKKRWPAR